MCLTKRDWKHWRMLKCWDRKLLISFNLRVEEGTGHSWEAGIKTPGTGLVRRPPALIQSWWHSGSPHEKGNSASQKNIRALGIQEDEALKAISDFLTHINIYSYQTQNFKLWLCYKDDFSENTRRCLFSHIFTAGGIPSISQSSPKKMCCFTGA